MEVLCVRANAWIFPGHFERGAVKRIALEDNPGCRILKIMPFGFAWLVVLSGFPGDKANEPGADGGGGERPVLSETEFGSQGCILDVEVD